MISSPSWRLQRLAAARKQLNELVNTYDMERRVCGECGLAHYRDFEDSQNRARVQGILQKLDTLIEVEKGRLPNEGAKRSDQDGKTRTD